MIKNILLLVFILGLFGCSTTEKKSSETYTVSILPQKFFLDELTANQVHVNVMIPPGASPATFDPVPRQLQELHESKVYFLIGHIGFEQAWKNKLANQFPNVKFVDTSVGLPLQLSDHKHEGQDNHDHESASVDPHVWMSPGLMKRILLSMYENLSAQNTIDTSLLRVNYTQLSEKIDSVDHRFNHLFESGKGFKFLIFHPALTYFAADYGLEQIEMEFEGKEPSPMYLKNITDYAKKEGIKVIFIQEEFDKSNATVLAHEIKAELCVINPLAYDWFKMMDELYGYFEVYVDLD